MSDIVFVDTNILICAHDADADPKCEQTIAALKGIWESRKGRHSSQVLREFYLNVTRKLATPVARSTAREVVGAYRPWVRTPAAFVIQPVRRSKTKATPRRDYQRSLSVVPKSVRMEP